MSQDFLKISIHNEYSQIIIIFVMNFKFIIFKNCDGRFLTYKNLRTVCTIGQKKRYTPIHFNANYRTELKLVRIIMDYCLFQFDSLNFFLGVRLHKGSLPNINFFNINFQIFWRNRKVHLSSCMETNFHNVSNISLRVTRHRNYSQCEVLKGNFFLLNISGENEIKWRNS